MGIHRNMLPVFSSKDYSPDTNHIASLVSRVTGYLLPSFHNLIALESTERV